jgi:hypothetical protein
MFHYYIMLFLELKISQKYVILKYFQVFLRILLAIRALVRLVFK